MVAGTTDAKAEAATLAEVKEVVIAPVDLEAEAAAGVEAGGVASAVGAEAAAAANAEAVAAATASDAKAETTSVRAGVKAEAAADHLCPRQTLPQALRRIAMLWDKRWPLDLPRYWLWVAGWLLVGSLAHWLTGSVIK